MSTKLIYKTTIYTCLFTGLALFMGGCKKFLEPDNKLKISNEVVFSNDGNAAAAINGLYATMANNTNFNGVITIQAGWASDELSYFVAHLYYDQFQKNQLLPNHPDLKGIWDDYYNVIYQCNSIIENATASAGITHAYKTQIIGEAKFFRAFCHFYLVNYFGPVPLITATSKEVTAYAPRNTVEEIYAQIKTDLTDAGNSLPGDYSVSSGKRIRANKWAALALLARVYLYQKNWAGAETTAAEVIANNTVFSLQTNANINNVFKKNQSESILEFERTTGANNINTYEGRTFLSYSVAGYPMLAGLLNSFDGSDARKTNWITTISGVSTPYKYKKTIYDPAEENYLLLRLAEQYLIRAEARAQQNNISGAQADINMIRNRAGLANDITMIDKATAMAAVENERRHELFCEWGHRWFDLKRWPSLTSPATKTRADDVLGALKTTWKSTSILFPIPQTARDANPNLTQNDGY